MKKSNLNKVDQECDNTSCMVHDGLQIIGGKWKSMIMYALMQHKFIRFNQLKSMIPNVSQKMLTQKLKELERDGLIERKVYPEVPPHVEYSLTELGLSIGHIYRSIHLWQQTHIKSIEECRKHYDSIQ
ncbi:winged helix-turn-helix transcriptional regulator [Shewanella marina]|uniref:winged helix-turn-helix transcriptional regulator n=1 Tax=Shewanella marina TaxID=487319 RepID=UPI0004704C6C|nr:helix-turn-helix domain-containing protein [Shewanella marina]